MSSSTPNILAWAAAELPGTSLPSAEDVSHLTAGPAAKELWKFLTTRVLSEAHAQRARAVLVVADGNYRVAVPDDELENVTREIADVENELRELRLELREGGGKGASGCMREGVSVQEIREGGRRELWRVGEEILDRVEEGVAVVEAVGGMERFGGEEEDAWGEEFSAVLGDLCALWIEGEGIGGEVEEKVKEDIFGVGLGQVCEALLAEVRRNVGEVRGWKGEWVESKVEDVEALARDVHQRSYNEYEEVWRECQSAVEKVEKEISGIEEGREERLFRAQVAGENAAIQFAESTIDDIKGEMSGKLRREVGRRNERVEEIFRACGEVRNGSRMLLERACDRRRKVVEMIAELEVLRTEALEGVANGIEEVVKEDDRVKRFYSTGFREEEEKRENKLVEKIQDVRQAEAEKIEGEVVEMFEQVLKSGEMAFDMWELMLGNVENGLFGRIKEIMEEARGVREAEVRYVQEELRNWLKCPGSEAARAVGLLKRK